MPVANRTKAATPAPGLPAAAILHAALIGWLASLAIQQFDVAPLAEQSVEVELQTQAEFEAQTRPKPPPAPPSLPVEPRLEATPQPAAPPEPKPESPAAPAPTTPPAASDGMIHPPRLLSQRVMADPRSREARAALPRLAPDERIEQLCGLEAMGQIHDWQRGFEPDRVTAYALADTRRAGQVLTADGAAFRSKQHWYALRFACTISPDLKRVAAFAFQVGDPIPQDRWEDLGLPAVH